MSKPTPQNETPAPVARPRPSEATGFSADVLQLSFGAILKQVPQELWGRLAPAGAAGASFSLFTQQALDQLPHGSVKIPFGELRRAAPSGLFTNSTAQDGRLIDLPLSEILAQLHPETFARRPSQARIEVSDELPDLFGSKGERLAPLRVMEKKEISSIAQRQNSPVAPASGNILPVPASFQRPPAVHPAPAPQIRPQASAGQTAPPRSAAFASAQAPATKPLPKSNTIPPKPSQPVQPFSTLFFIALDVVAEYWPEGIRQELARLKLPDAKIGLPPVDVCEGLKRHCIQYPWRTIRSWIQPPPLYSANSPYDDTVVGLPLEKLTPLFLDFIRAHPVNRRAAAAENITEFFRKAEEAAGTGPAIAEALLAASPSRSQPAPFQEPAVASPSAFAFQPTQPSPVRFPQAAPAAAVAASAASGTAPTWSSDEAAAPPGEGSLAVPLAQVCAEWPEPVLRDISQFNLSQCALRIPLDYIEAGLKSGRVEFTWRQICAWLNPPSHPAQLSINGENRVLLPLNVLAPLFMTARGGTPARKKARINEAIPDLFSATGTPQQPAAPATAPTPAKVPAPASPAAAQVSPAPAAVTAAPKKTPANLNELFNDPEKRTWTPNDIVQKTAALPGVAGAMIALQDGLLVAACMPPTSKTETIAAFIPQIFGRMNQYSKELQMGECRSVALSVDSGTLHVFSAGIIYFAALSLSNTPLPLPELQLITRELSRHTK